MKTDRFRRMVFLAALSFSLSACGFQPIYGNFSAGADPEVAAKLNRVSLANIKDHQGQSLRNRLIDRMYGHGRPTETDAVLSVFLRSNEIDLGIQKDATAARRELNLWADYVLSDKDGNKLLSGTAHSIVSYSKLSAQYGTLAAQDSAKDRAVNEVAEQIVNRVSLYYATTPEKTAEASEKK